MNRRNLYSEYNKRYKPTSSKEIRATSYGPSTFSRNSLITPVSKWSTFTLPQLKEFAVRYGYTLPKDISKEKLIELLNSRNS